ncbi:MAG: hypothetical protein K9N47_20980 [Prosthecobacter sp.]|uniref:hypothetical protein n=1 Tax=Prosthecobacter sp. TaxID=1965333 RepID=UPI002619ABBF|nr:hypothetical protein [Prosthecobacter sp.]MCF7788610.1 hypothetical protein [Prosthecobacter sp.]
MSKNLQDQATTTTTPTNWFVNIAGSVRQLTAASFTALLDSLWARTASPALTGTPTAPTQIPGDNSTKIATTAYADASAAAAAAALVAAAPGTLDTLNELAAALGDDANYAATVTAALAAKQEGSTLGAASAAAVHAATAKTTPADADEFGLADSEASWGLKKLTWVNIKTALGLLYAALTHAAQHKSGGADAIKLDELAAPTDVTTLDATTSAHGLLPKLGGGTTNFLRADGTWAAPAGGGASISLPLRAWVESTGNDGTGAVGDPGKPYLTMLAAYTAGARMMHLGAGTFAGITKSGDIDLTYIGHGRGKTTITAISTTTGGAVSLRDVGFKSATIGSITYSYAGSGGGSAGALVMHNVLISGDVTASGEAGLGGVDALSPHGGMGGAGAFLSGSNIEILGNCYLSGGAGGPAFDTGFDPSNGGSGGQGGQVSVTGRLYIFYSLVTNGGGAYTGLYGGTDGSPGSGGSLTVDDIYIGSSASLLAGGETATPGSLTSFRAYIQSADFGGSSLNFASIIGALIIIPSANGTPTTGGLLLSHINGMAVGTT